jgi:hypothetical protein
MFARWFRKRPSSTETHLLRLCRGDAEQMERLIRHEVTRLPHLSRPAATQAAIERWQRQR